MRSRSLSAPGQIAGGIRDEQHAELALLAPFGVESRGHQVGGCVAPRQSAVERRKPAAQVERFPGNAAAGGIVHHRERLAARGIATRSPAPDAA